MSVLTGSERGRDVDYRVRSALELAKDFDVGSGPRRGRREDAGNTEGETAREFYALMQAPGVVGIEATGSTGWILRLMGGAGDSCSCDS
jgi:hypothetical protein